MNKSDIDKLFIKELGTPFSQKINPVLDQFVQIFKLELKNQLKLINEEKPELAKNVKIDIVDNIQFNATAYSNDNIEMIGINVGTTLLPIFLYFWMLSNSKILPEIGEISNEQQPEFDLNLSLFMSKSSLEEISLAKLISQLNQPKDKVRFNYAIFCMRMTWNFILMHELAHINRCHIAYLQSHLKLDEQNQNKLLEFAKHISLKRSQIKNILEIDADTIASQLLSGAPVKNKLSDVKTMLFGEDYKPDKMGWNETFKYWVLPIGILFHVTSFMDKKISIKSKFRSHPHPHIRMQLLSNFLWNHWKKVIPNRQEFISLNRSASDMIQDIYKIANWDLPENVKGVNYYENLKSVVNDLWKKVHESGKELNILTEQRWAKMKSSR